MADPTTHGPKCEEAVVQEADPRQNPLFHFKPSWTVPASLVLYGSAWRGAQPCASSESSDSDLRSAALALIDLG